MRKKTLVLFVMTVLNTCTLFAQLQEVKIEPRVLFGEFRNGPNFAKLERDGTLCYLTFRDEVYQYVTDIRRIEFLDKQQDLDSLHNAFKEMVTGPEGKDRSFLLGNNKILISKSSTWGISILTVSTDNGLFTLTKKGVDQLFGKR